MVTSCNNIRSHEREEETKEMATVDAERKRRYSKTVKTARRRR